MGNRRQNKAAEWEGRHPEKRNPGSLQVQSCWLRPAGTDLTDDAVVAVGRESPPASVNSQAGSQSQFRAFGLLFLSSCYLLPCPSGRDGIQDLYSTTGAHLNPRQALYSKVKWIPFALHGSEKGVGTCELDQAKKDLGKSAPEAFGFPVLLCCPAIYRRPNSPKKWVSTHLAAPFGGQHCPPSRCHPFLHCLRPTSLPFSSRYSKQVVGGTESAVFLKALSTPLS